ncbi:MAG: glycosyltransferase family 4 protein [Thermomonas haemolytica]
MSDRVPAVWFPTIRAGTGADVFTERLAAELRGRGFQADITWLPLRAEYAPSTVRVPKVPGWATVCHVNTWLHPRFIPRQLPVVATLHHSIHDPALEPYKGWLRAAYHRWWIAPVERRVLCRADRVVAVSQFVADMARQTLCDVPMQVICNGIDAGLFRPGCRARQKSEPFRLLYVGSWMARKGVDLLAPIMRQLGDGFELHYTGGEEAARDRPEMPPNMHDIGRLSGSSVAAAMQAADAFLFPSRSEGLPLVVIEAMACGLPVIGVRETAVSEVVEHGVTGFLCPRDDVPAFVAAVQALSGNTQRRIDMAHAAHKAVIARFSFTSMVDAYVRLYQSLGVESA